MDVKEAKTVIRQLLKSPTYLLNSKSILEKQILTKGFLIGLGMICIDKKHDSSERLLSALILKYLVTEYWASGKLKSNEKTTLRQLILENIVSLEYKIAFHLGVMLGHIGDIEFSLQKPDSSVLDGILESLENEKEGDGLDGLFEALFIILRASDQKFTKYASKILASLFSAFVNAEGNECRRSKCLFLVYLCLRTFAWADGTDNELVAKCLDDTFSPWMALIVSIFQTNPKTNFEIKRNALRVLVVLIRDFMNYTHAALNMILEPVWKLLTIHLPIYIHTVCYERNLERLPGDPELNYVKYPFMDTEAFEDDEPGIEGMTKQLIDLITTLIANPAISTLIRTGLGPFTSTLCAYLLLPESLLDSYKQSPLYFIEGDELTHGDGGTELSENIRALVTRILENLVENFGSSTVDTLQTIALDCLTFNGMVKKPSKIPKKPGKEQSAYDSVSIYEYVTEVYDKHEHWRKYENGLYLLAFLSDDLFVALEKGQKFVNLPKIIEALSAICKSPYLYNSQNLLGRLLSAASETLQLYNKTNPIIMQFIEVSCNSLKGQFEDSVKYIACKCLVRCAHHLQALPIKDPTLIIKCTQNLQRDCEISNLHILSETISTTFIYSTPKLLIPYLKDIIGSYLRLFINSESDCREFADLMQKLSKNTQYISPIVCIYIPMIAPIIEKYPSGCSDPSFIRVFFYIE